MEPILAQLPCGIMVIDEGGIIQLINGVAEQHLGYTPGELVGQPVSLVLTVASRLLYQTHVYPLLNLQGRLEEVVLTLQTKQGHRLPVLLNAVRQVANGQGLIYGAYLPLSQRYHYEAELIQARQTAEAAQLALQASEAKYRALAASLEVRVEQRTNELAIANTHLRELNQDLTRANANLEQFATVASHDLQEPLRKIQQFGSLLQLRQDIDKMDAESANYVARMQVAASQMSTLIRDLLALSRVSTQRSPQERVSLNEVVSGVLDTLDMAITDVAAQVQVGLLPVLSGDAVQLSQLFQNLLSNALKFRRLDVVPQISVSSQTVTADSLPPALTPTRRTASYHLIKVADNGIGFEEKYLDRIFQVFQRLHGKSQYAGTGIGLAICETVVTSHGGAITASSQPGQGATFSVYLPAQVS